MVEKSNIPTLQIDTTLKEWGEYVCQISAAAGVS